MPFALLYFEKPLISTLYALVIGSKFDTDIAANICRLGFYGQIV